MRLTMIRVIRKITINLEVNLRMLNTMKTDNLIKNKGNTMMTKEITINQTNLEEVIRPINFKRLTLKKMLIQPLKVPIYYI